MVLAISGLTKGGEGGDEDLWSSTSAESNAMLPHAAPKQTYPDVSQPENCAANSKTKPAERNWQHRKVSQLML
jgi:hypothetical protein